MSCSHSSHSFYCIVFPLHTISFRDHHHQDHDRKSVCLWWEYNCKMRGDDDNGDDDNGDDDELHLWKRGTHC